MSVQAVCLFSRVEPTPHCCMVFFSALGSGCREHIQLQHTPEWPAGSAPDRGEMHPVTDHFQPYMYFPQLLALSTPLSPSSTETVSHPQRPYLVHRYRISSTETVFRPQRPYLVHRDRISSTETVSRPQRPYLVHRNRISSTETVSRPQRPYLIHRDRI